MKRSRSIRPRRESAGFSLVEVMIAACILGLLCFSMMSSAIFSARYSRLNTNAIAAKNIAQGYFERMAIDTFANVGNTVLYPNVAYTSNPPVWLDQALNIKCKVDLKFKGYGTATGGGSTSLNASNPAWTANEWAGDVVYIVAGRGAGQFARIASNTTSSLSLSDVLQFAPDATSKFMINNGKTVQITTTWQYMGKDYSETIQSLVVNYRGDANLGF